MKSPSPHEDPNRYVYRVTRILACGAYEGAPVDEVELGLYSARQVAMEAIRKAVVASQDLAGSTYWVIGYRIEEVPIDVVNHWQHFLSDLYNRSALYSPEGTLVCETPGIDELWEHGTLRVPFADSLGDRVAFTQKRHGEATTLKFGVIVYMPTVSPPDALRQVHGSKLHDEGMDVTDTYVWLSVSPADAAYDDEQRTQTQLFRISLPLPPEREQKLTELGEFVRASRV